MEGMVRPKQSGGEGRGGGEIGMNGGVRGEAGGSEIHTLVIEGP